jgi:nucleotide-binding universal stress UspA family protein
MDELRKNLKDKHPDLTIRTQVCRGAFISELNHACEKIRPYCVVMGSQGASTADYRMFGSQTVQAMKKIHSPVIAVPPGTGFNYFKKIGIACDLENGIDHVPTEDIKKITKDFNASIHILNSAGRRGRRSKIIEEASALADVLSPLPHEFHFISNADDDMGIIDFTEKNNMDLLVVLPRKHTLFDKWTHASLTQKIVLQMSVPVMALHFAESKS